MSNQKIIPTRNEVFFGDDELIVSKTDLRGKITYANDVFIRISGYTEDEVLGSPHSMIRHPEMPRAVFKLLWDTLESGHEIFAYVKNMCKDGSFYWVFAHVTPTKDTNGRTIGYHSNRRTPDRSSIAVIDKLYSRLRDEELRHSDPRKGLEASYAMLTSVLHETKKPYEEFIWSVAAQ